MKKYIFFFLFLINYFFSFAQDKTELKIQIGHTDEITSISISNNGKYFATCGYDKTIKIWDYQTGKEIKTLLGHKEWVNTITFNKENNKIISGSSDNTIKLWDIYTGKIIKSIEFIKQSEKETIDGVVYSVICSPDGKYIIAGGGGNYYGGIGVIKVYNTQTYQCIKTIKVNAAGVSSISINSKNNTIVSGSFDGSINIWNLLTGALIKSQNNIVCDATGLQVKYTPDGKNIICGDRFI